MPRCHYEKLVFLSCLRSCPPHRPLLRLRWPFVFLLLAFLTLGAGAQTIDGFVLVDARADQDLRPLQDGEVLNLAAFPGITVRAAASGAGSVRFAVNGRVVQTENVAPYALNGDTRGDYRAWTPGPGTYTLTATPYGGRDASGAAGTPRSVTLTLTNGDDPGDEPTEDPPGSGAACTSTFPSGYQLTGERRTWHAVTLTFEGPCLDEAPSTFRDYRLEVTFSQGGRSYRVPGYFAADGRAHETSATRGNRWRVHFVPPSTGAWQFRAAFFEGAGVAVNGGGRRTSFDGTSGSFSVQETNKTGRDHRARGMLRYVGERYLRFDSGAYFLKGGADSPENFLAYRGFDGTYNAGGTDYTKTYAAHERDWRPGDPTWKNGQGKGIIGAVNYLASEGMNAVYFLTMNVQGDGKDVWPWTSPSERSTYDVSKLAQWEAVFSHMDRQGLMLHVVTQETENDQLLGGLSTERKLYYRELVARFAHHHALTWNVGEENTNTDSERKAFAAYLQDLDPYDHPIVVHTYPGQKDRVYGPLLGHEAYMGASLQLSQMNGGYEATKTWVERSAQAGRPWVVTLDEPGNAQDGVKPDGPGNNHAQARKEALWANLLAGGAGVEWYFGYRHRDSDLTGEDWRSRDRLWDYTRYALQFVQALPFTDMTPQNGLLSGPRGYVFGKDDLYAVYVKNASTSARLGVSGSWELRWFNPRTGQYTSAQTVRDGRLGQPPSEQSQDWAAVLMKADATPPVEEPAGVVRVNVGGGDVTSGGVTWQADTYHRGGNTYDRSGLSASDLDVSAAQAGPATLYLTERWGNPFAYALPVPTPGTYAVTLHFAEIYFGVRRPGGAGQRVFSVQAEGQPLPGAYDLYAEVGAATVVVRRFEVAVQDGTLDLSFTASANNAKLSAIEVAPVSVTNAAFREAPEPLAFALEPAFPSPARTQTAIAFQLPEAMPVQIVVYDVLGRQVATVADRTYAAGRHEVTWRTEALPGGLYLYRLEAGSYTASRTVTVVP